jgi:aspartate 4-decarboxylase
VAKHVPHTSREIQRRYEQLSPFELKAFLGQLAAEHEAGVVMSAGRGNPNWVATVPRQAFFALGEFALGESRRAWSDGPFGGMPAIDGIAERFDGFVDRLEPGPAADLLRFAATEGRGLSGLGADAWVHELADAVIGDNYPMPPRMLPGIERVVRRHLVAELYGTAEEHDSAIDVFAVEGATAAMCDVFETLVVNHLLEPGDRIALGCPVFTPYLAIPALPRYGFDVVELDASGTGEGGVHTWQFPDDEVDRLADPAIRALFIVNPSNPGSVAMQPSTLERLVAVVQDRNPGLLVVTDDVYGPFVQGYRSLFERLPRNTIGVYSFSKFWGATGWRLGTVSIHRDNVFDEALAALPPATKDQLARRYGSISLDPEGLSFMDRLVADSRQVALNHTAGLSTPQQAQMALFALAGLSDVGAEMRAQLHRTLERRLALLFEGLDVPLYPDPYRSAYYVELDLLDWARRLHGDALADWVEANFEPVDVLFRLAEQEAVVLLNGGGFDAPAWSVRVSLANLDDDAYRRIGQAVRRVGAQYVAEFAAAGGTLGG